MGREKNESTPEDKHQVRTKFYEEPIIENLKEIFELSDLVLDASILIFRLFVGLGKGLTESQKKSYAAASVWYATKVIEKKNLSKSKLADKLNISSRTLTRRFKDLEDDENSKFVLDYVKQRIRDWSNEREKRLQKLL